MANPIFYSEALEDATLTYSATEDAANPIENVQDRNVNTIFKDTTISANVNIVIDLGAVRACDYIFLGNYQADGAAVANLTVQANSSDSWPGTEALAATNIETAGSYTDKLMTFSTQSFQWWRLVFEGSSTVMTNLFISNIFLGTSFQPSLNRNWGMREGRLSNITQRQTHGAQQFTNKNGAIRKTWSGMSYQDIQETQKDNTLTLIQNVENNHKPLYFDPIGDGTEYFVRMQESEHGLNDSDFQNYNSDPIRFIEEI